MVWQGYVDSNGYGRVSINGRRAQRVHRAMWAALNGPVPEGSVIHHTCANRLCVTPKHLQAVTPASNAAEMLERQKLRDRVDLLERLLDKLADHTCECAK